MARQFRLYIELENAAFKNPTGEDVGNDYLYERDEVVRILRALATDIEHNELPEGKPLKDISGNTVGRAFLQE